MELHRRWTRPGLHEPQLAPSIFSIGTTDCSKCFRALCSDWQELLPSISVPGARHDPWPCQHKGGVTRTCMSVDLLHPCAELIRFCWSRCLQSRAPDAAQTRHSGRFQKRQEPSLYPSNSLQVDSQFLFVSPSL